MDQTDRGPRVQVSVVGATHALAPQLRGSWGSGNSLSGRQEQTEPWPQEPPGKFHSCCLPAWGVGAGREVASVRRAIPKRQSCESAGQ